MTGNLGVFLSVLDKFSLSQCLPTWTGRLDNGDTFSRSSYRMVLEDCGPAVVLTLMVHINTDSVSDFCYFIVDLLPSSWVG